MKPASILDDETMTPAGQTPPSSVHDRRRYFLPAGVRLYNQQLTRLVSSIQTLSLHGNSCDIFILIIDLFLIHLLFAVSLCTLFCSEPSCYCGTIQFIKVR